MYTAPDYPQGVCHIRKAAELPTAVQCVARAALQATNCQCRGARGDSPRHFSWGCKGDILFPRKENIPLLNPQEKGRGEAPSTPDIAGLILERLHALRSVGAVYMASP